MKHGPLVVFWMLILSSVESGPAFGRTWTVGHSGAEDFDKVLEACAAASAWDSILVSPGDYDESSSFYLDDVPLTILGSGATPDDTRLGLHIRQRYCAGSVLQNVSIRRDGGVWSSDGSIRISDCTIRSDMLRTPINLRSTGCVVEDCIFSGNGPYEAQDFDGCIYATEDVVIRRCVFVDNTSTIAGAALTLHSFTHTTVEDCVFTGNTAPQGAAIWIFSGSPTIRRCTFWGNRPTGPDGATILIETQVPRFSHCIIGGTIGGWGVACSGAGGLECSVLWDNDAGDYLGNWFNASEILGNFREDPMLCDPDQGDFGLQVGSPCLPGNHHGVACERVGARDAGCGLIPTTHLTWGKLRFLFR